MPAAASTEHSAHIHRHPEGQGMGLSDTGAGVRELQGQQGHSSNQDFRVFKSSPSLKKNDIEWIPHEHIAQDPFASLDKSTQMTPAVCGTLSWSLPFRWPCTLVRTTFTSIWAHTRALIRTHIGLYQAQGTLVCLHANSTPTSCITIHQVPLT